jgi:hypothetical protein
VIKSGGKVGSIKPLREHNQRRDPGSEDKKASTLFLTPEPLKDINRCALQYPSKTGIFDSNYGISMEANNGYPTIEQLSKG